MNPALLDTSIPILTEVIPPPSAEEPVAVPVQNDAGSAALLPEPAAATAALEPGDTEMNWDELEHEISLRVLGQLQGRIDFVLEHRVRDSLADVLQTAVESLATEIRRGLQNTLEEVVTRAVAQEVTHLRSSKK
jgi:hypothetical protein